MTRAELILYATPTGALGAALDRIFGRIADRGPTTAQDYPPHCTLTGFFHRHHDEIPRIVAEVDEAVAEIGPPPERAVDVVSLHRRADWIGLELASDWLHAVTAAFVAVHRVDAGDDALRPKAWLHLSIGYGVDDLTAADAAARELDPTVAAPWEIALWQRHRDGHWSRPSRRRLPRPAP